MSFAIAFGVFLLFWLGVGYLIARQGWAQLAVAHATATAPHGDRFRWVSGSVGGVHYRASLTVSISEDGVYVRSALLFRAFHPTLCFIWADAELVGNGDLAELRLGKGGLTPLCIVSPAMWRNVRRHIAPQLVA